MSADLEAAARLARLFENYFDRLPGEALFDSRNTTPVDVTVAPILIHSFNVDRRGAWHLSGFSTSPTALDVTFRLIVNGQQIVETALQPSAALWTLHPVRMSFQSGPALIEIWGTSNTGANVVGVHARVAGWFQSGSKTDPQRIER